MELNKKRLLIVSPGIPHPQLGASTVLFYYYLEALKNAGYTILNILLIREQEYSHEQFQEYCQRLENDSFKVKPCVSKDFVVSKHYRYHFNDSALRQIKACVDNFAPHLFLGLDILSAWAGQLACKTKTMVWLGDLNFQTQWYHAYYSWQEGKISMVQLLSNWMWSRAWKPIYKKVLHACEKVIVSSQSSVKVLKRFNIRSQYLPYPWPEVLRERDDKSKNSVPSFLFLGTLTALGSRSAFHWLIKKLYPAMIAEFGKQKFKINICGRGELPEWAETLLKGKEEVEFKGFVDDLSELMVNSHAMIAPIDVPVGNRSRILTMMAGHLLVIAHPNTSRANPLLVDGETCYLAASIKDFINRMRRAVYQPVEAEQIISRAHQAYQNHFLPKQATSLLLREVEVLL